LLLIHDQNLWALDPKYPQDTQQIRFAGVHSDMGGGHAEPESGLAKITLKWMLEQAEAQGFSLDHALKDQILGFTDPNMAKPDCLGVMHNSLNGWWWILELLPRRHFDTRLTPPQWKWELPLASPRYIALGSSIHTTVGQCMAGTPMYRPSNLPLVQD
jgi:hypothetical protein